MHYRAIIHDAWVFTKANKPLMIWYSFIPSLLTTVVGITYLLYQFFAFKRSHWFENSEVSFLREAVTIVASFFQEEHNLIVPAIIVGSIALILYLLVPTICQGGLIQITARRRRGETVQNIDGISYGLLSFLVLFQYHLFLKTFSFIGIFTEMALVVRNFDEGVIEIMLPIFLLFLTIGIILALLFTYAEFFIVLEKDGVLKAIGRSTKLVILNWKHTLLIGILMLIIGIRIIINIIAVLLVPTLIIISGGLFATVALAKIGFIIALLIGLITLLVVAYFNGIIHVFANSVWTYTFLELISEEKNKEFL